MTFSLRRKRPITAVRSTPARTAVNLLGLGLLFGTTLGGATSCLAQASGTSAGAPTTPTLYFAKPAGVVGGTQSIPTGDVGTMLPPPPAHPTLFFSRQSIPVSNTPATASGPVASVPSVVPTAGNTVTFGANRNATTGSGSGSGTSSVGSMTTSGSTSSGSPIQAMSTGSGEPSAQLTAMQAVEPNEKKPGTDQKAPGEEDSGYSIQLEPPGPKHLFQLDSEAALMERMRQEARQRTPLERIEFPGEPILAPGRRYVPRTFATVDKKVEPAYVCYNPLYFEGINAERYGWDFGPIQPMASALWFYKDLALLPARLAIHTGCNRYDCSAGLCLPGDPVPLHLRPFDIRVSGLAAEAATALAILAIFP